MEAHLSSRVESSRVEVESLHVAVESSALPSLASAVLPPLQITAQLMWRVTDARREHTALHAESRGGYLLFERAHEPGISSNILGQALGGV